MLSIHRALPTLLLLLPTLLLNVSQSEGGFLFPSSPQGPAKPTQFRFSETFIGTWQLERLDQTVSISDEEEEDANSEDDPEVSDVMNEGFATVMAKSNARYVIVSDNMTDALVGKFYDDEDHENNHLVRVEFDEDENGNVGRFFTDSISDENQEYLLEAPDDDSHLFRFDFSAKPSDSSSPSKAAVSMGRWNGNEVGWYTFVFTSPSSFVLNVVPVTGGKGSAFVILGTRVAGPGEERTPPPWYVRFGPSLAISAFFILRRLGGGPPRGPSNGGGGGGSAASAGGAKTD